MNKVIFFDFFGVISSEVAVVFFKNLLAEDEAMKIKDSIFTRADAGEIDEDETYRLISEATNLSTEYIRDQWNSLPHIDPKMVEYIMELRKDHKVYLLSNAISAYLRNLLEMHDLYKCFDKVFISAELRKIKPHADYFQYALDDLNLKGEDCIMIDDNPENIKGAESVGINGIVFKGLDDLKIKINQIENK